MVFNKISSQEKLNIQAGLILAFFISGRLATIADKKDRF